MNKKKEGEKRSTEIKRQFLRAVSNWAFHEDLDDDVGYVDVGGDVDGLVLVRYFHSLSSFHLFNSFIGVEITNIYSIYKVYIKILTFSEIKSEAKNDHQVSAT